MKETPLTIPWDVDVIGFCAECFRIRWLRVITDESESKMPKGICRQCVRESEQS